MKQSYEYVTISPEAMQRNSTHVSHSMKEVGLYCSIALHMFCTGMIPGSISDICRLKKTPVSNPGQLLPVGVKNTKWMNGSFLSAVLYSMLTGGNLPKYKALAEDLLSIWLLEKYPTLNTP